MNIDEIKRRIAAEQAMRRAAEPQGYERFSAAELYCPKCKRAMPVRENPLLYVGTGQLYDYLCTGCGESLGTRQD